MKRTLKFFVLATLVFASHAAVDPKSQGSAEIFRNPDNTLNIYWCYQRSGGCVVGFLSTLKKVF